jgi:copper chaperone CopZ
VKSVEVSFEQERATVLFDADKVTVQQLIDAVNQTRRFKASLAGGG